MASKAPGAAEQDVQAQAQPPIVAGGAGGCRACGEGPGGRCWGAPAEGPPRAPHSPQPGRDSPSSEPLPAYIHAFTLQPRTCTHHSCAHQPGTWVCRNLYTWGALAQIHLYAHAHVCLHTHTEACPSCAQTHTHTHTCACMNTYTHVCTLQCSVCTQDAGAALSCRDRAGAQGGEGQNDLPL